MTASRSPPPSAGAGTCSESRPAEPPTGPALSDTIASRLARAASALARSGCGGGGTRPRARKSSSRAPFARALLVGPNTEASSSALDSALSRSGFDWIRPEVPLSCEGQLDSAYRSLLLPFLRRGRSVAAPEPGPAGSSGALPKLIVFEQYVNYTDLKAALSRLASLSGGRVPSPRSVLVLCLVDENAGSPPAALFSLSLARFAPPAPAPQGSRAAAAAAVSSRVPDPPGSADRWSALAKRYSEFASGPASSPAEASAFRLGLMKELESDPESTMYLAVWMVRNKADACAARDPALCRRLVSAVAAGGRLRSAASRSLLAQSVVCGLGLCCGS